MKFSIFFSSRIWPGIKWAYNVTVKHWRKTIGSLFALFLAWSVVLHKIDFQTAAGALLIMWVGGYVNRKIDLSAIGKVFTESKNTVEGDIYDEN